MTQNGISIGLGYRERRYGLIVKVEDIAFAFFVKQPHLFDVHDIFPVASYQVASLEALFDGLEAAPEHVLLKLTLAVRVPYLYIVVVRLYIIEVLRAE